jgi:restriction endonuclease
MKDNLYHAAKKYVEIIEKIEETTDLKELQQLEEKRIECHWKFIDLLKKQGIKFKDRDHATRIAQRIVNGEL